MTDRIALNQQTKERREPRGKPRRRAAPVWRRWWVRISMVSLVLALVAGAGWWTVRSGSLNRLVDIAKREMVAASVHVGLRIDEVLVMGRKETDRDELLSALGTTRGAPILAFDVDSAKERVAKLPWVRRVSVERILPDTVLLTVEERAPLALWQNGGTFALIDYEGHVILREDLEPYRNLVIVVGEDAPIHTASLLETLASQPVLMDLVQAAVRVGGRRWNLRLRGGIDVRLPEDNAITAWRRLAQYQRSHGVLERDVRVIDLRLSDRLIVRKSPVIEAVKPEQGQET